MPTTTTSPTGRGPGSSPTGNGSSLAEAPEVFDDFRAENLIRRSQSALKSVTSALDARERQGRVRRCHGDLHLRNIVLLGDEPTLFDAIEFDDRIATGDVLYDLAFLVMDIWRHGHRANASRAFNRYLTVQGDASDLAALASPWTVR